MPEASVLPEPGAQAQHAVMEFLSRPESYGAASPTPVARVDSHCSVVFLVGDFAYKLKRPIAFASLDYTTLASREAACRAEVELNSRTAPDLYLGIRSINRTPDGSLAFDGPGPVLDWVVVMRRFEQDNLFSCMAEKGRLTAGMMRALGVEIARFHAAAEITPKQGGAAGMRRAIDANRQELARFATVLGRGPLRRLHTRSLAALARLADVLDRRRDEGYVRRCHGDLRLANICLFHGRPTLFDGIEFSDEVSCVDVFYDLAFLLMDLREHGHPSFARIVLDTYVGHTGDAGGLACLPLFLSVRAAHRCFTLTGKAMRQRDSAMEAVLIAEARSHLASAVAYLSLPSPFGISATAGSNAARAPDPGAILLPLG